MSIIISAVAYLAFQRAASSFAVGLDTAFIIKVPSVSMVACCKFELKFARPDVFFVISVVIRFSNALFLLFALLFEIFSQHARPCAQAKFKGMLFSSQLDANLVIGKSAVSKQ